MRTIIQGRLRKENIKTVLLFIILNGYILSTNLVTNNINNVVTVLRGPFLFALVSLAAISVINLVLGRHLSVLELYLLMVALYFCILILGGNHNESISNILMDNLYLIIVFFAAILLVKKIVQNETVYDASLFALQMVFAGLFIVNRIGNGFVSITNTVYYQVCLLPNTMFSRSKRIRIISFIVVSFCVFFSGKRIAFICWALSILFSLISIQKNEKRSSKGKRFIRAVFAIIVIAIAVFSLDSFMSLKYGTSIVARLLSIQEDGGSGRLFLLTEGLKSIKNSNMKELLFGHRMHSTVSIISGIGAHNDFIEIIHKSGFVGLLFFLLIVIKIIKEIHRIKGYDYNLWLKFSCILLCFFVFMMFSQILFIAVYNGFFAIDLAISHYYYMVATNMSQNE